MWCTCGLHVILWACDTSRTFLCMSTTYPSDLTDAEWDCAERHLPPMSKRGRLRMHPLRRILDAIFYLLRAGCAWRYLPSDFPP